MTFNSLVSFSISKSYMEIEESTDPPNTLDHGKTTVNQYATKKTLALSNLEIALLTTNAVQLKTLLGHKDKRDTLWLVSFVLVIVSLAIQVLNACILVVLGSGDLSKIRRQHCLVLLNNFSLILTVLVNVVNIVLNIIIIVEPDVLQQTNTTAKIF